MAVDNIVFWYIFVCVLMLCSVTDIYICSVLLVSVNVDCFTSCVW